MVSDEFEERYDCDQSQELGKGAFSVVRLCNRKGKGGPNDPTWAVKIIERSNLNRDDLEDIQQEIKILTRIKEVGGHPNIMTLDDTIETSDRFYLISEHIQGGELFERIVGKVCYTEKEARDTIKILLSAIAYCHDHRIVHRDLKPENLLLTCMEDDSNIKVADFGLAREVPEGTTLDTVCGTPTYVAPEILEMEGYGLGVDIWSIGIITFILLCGYPPFRSDDADLSALFHQIKYEAFEFKSPFWDPISAEARQFVSRMLVKDPKQRATAQELLNDPWIIAADVSEQNLQHAAAGIKAFHARRKWKMAISTVRLSVRLNKMSQESAAAAKAKEQEENMSALSPEMQYFSEAKSKDFWMVSEGESSMKMV